MWVTSLRVPKKDFERVLKICEDIARRDRSFRYKVVGKRIRIYSDDKDIAYGRGSWFVYKVNNRIRYTVYWTPRERLEHERGS